MRAHKNTAAEARENECGSTDLACHLELSELRTSNHDTNVGGCVASFAKHATAVPTVRAQKTVSLASGPWQTRV